MLSPVRVKFLNDRLQYRSYKLHPHFCQSIPEILLLSDIPDIVIKVLLLWVVVFVFVDQLSLSYLQLMPLTIPVIYDFRHLKLVFITQILTLLGKQTTD